MEEIIHRAPYWLVIAGYCAELHLRVLEHQSGAEDFRPCGACQAPRGYPQGFVPGWEVAGRPLYRLAVVGPEEP